ARCTTRSVPATARRPPTRRRPDSGWPAWDLMPPRRMIECASWGGASPEVVAPLVARETQLWRTRFGWDLARDWAGLEAARVDGRVQGVLAHSVPERGDVGGWAFH